MPPDGSAGLSRFTDLWLQTPSQHALGGPITADDVETGPQRPVEGSGFETGASSNGDDDLLALVLFRGARLLRCARNDGPWFLTVVIARRPQADAASSGRR